MNILNIHGYRGVKDNTNFRILNSIPDSIVISQYFDYDTTDPKSIENYLGNLIEDNNIDIIVATSFGAFFGKILSVKHKIPLMATNPCLIPDISLKAIAPEYFNEANSRYVDGVCKINSCAGYKGDVFILGDSDEVIDHDNITRVIAKDATLYTVPGGHQLEESKYRDILIKEVTKKL